MSLLELNRIGHAFFGRTVLQGISLGVARQEIVALIGPSGSGKSTLAHIAAGLVDPREGRIIRRYLRHAMVFQDPRLMPWATAADNIGFPLRLARTPRGMRRRLVADAALRAGLLPEDLGKYPSELSGGMRQRAAIARALATDPDFIYFDEPFTALDVALKRRMQDLVIEAAASARFAALFITHDLLEAIRISHRILVLDAGGRGIAGERLIPGNPGSRDDQAVFALRQDYLAADPLFAHIHDIDERLRP
ncbi:ABC transporter ATP-binding protein [Paracoccus thiocyanatus]|uniref:Nitrate/sulfonate/bicarbonate ABC transporter ATP-binding protein n=1 Tax=Paracoccus thiocyanatus TaxID=34006 RepID=A0A3D8P984_9RHOB|nr:ATP-binding cassette domain-containing protein [Paracoccus thiocyanatus]RDW11898.1 nitrate/sulfonate/bicarbonate ABC transporter ATP-binding protein [Paracoccus thiocyanatus]